MLTLIVLCTFLTMLLLGLVIYQNAAGRRTNVGDRLAAYSEAGRAFGAGPAGKTAQSLLGNKLTGWRAFIRQAGKLLEWSSGPARLSTSLSRAECRSKDPSSWSSASAPHLRDLRWVWYLPKAN